MAGFNGIVDFILGADLMMMSDKLVGGIDFWLDLRKILQIKLKEQKQAMITTPFLLLFDNHCFIGDMKL